MKNTQFDLAKVRRAINTHGENFVFTHFGKTDYGEPDPETTQQITIKGLFHQTRGYITKNISDGTLSRSKPQPQILTLSITSITIDDVVEYTGKDYRVIGVDNIGNLGIAFDISLELIDNGT